MTTGLEKSKMVYALSMMRCGNKFHQRYQTKITARVYENLKGGRIVSEETKKKMRGVCGKSNIGKKQSIETKEKRRMSLIGQTRSEETKAKMSIAARNRKHSVETRQKLSEVNRGKKFSAETWQKISESVRRRKRLDH